MTSSYASIGCGEMGVAGEDLTPLKTRMFLNPRAWMVQGLRDLRRSFCKLLSNSREGYLLGVFRVSNTREPRGTPAMRRDYRDPALLESWVYRA